MMTEKIPIAGGPHTGKTTLLDALRVHFPEAYFVPEPATSVIARELKLEKERSGYQPRVPWINYDQFGPLAVQESEILEAEIPRMASIAFQDRSLIDAIAYFRLNNLDSLIPEIKRKIILAKYSFVFLCQPVGEYIETSARRESKSEALRTHVAIERAYNESGLDVILVPAMGIDERAAFIVEVLRSRNIA